MSIKDLGVDRIIGKEKINIKFGKEVKKWQRTLKEVVEGRVILQVAEGKKFIEKKGNAVIYDVFHLDEKLEVACDLTLLKFGKISLKNSGELFFTYGHLHEKNLGECYTCLKNEAFLVLVDKDDFNTKIVNMEEGDTAFIHPKYIHRLVVKDKDVAILGFVPKEAGHNYEVVKNKGLPYHIFREDEEFQFVHNDKYDVKELKFLNLKKNDINPINLFLKDTKKLRDILYNPKNYGDLYSI